MSTIRVLMLSLVLACASAGCSMSADTKAAEQGVDKFHAMLDASQFDEIYTDTTDNFKHITTRQDFVALLDAVHRKLGAMQSTKQQGWRINYNTTGAFVTLGYKTTYAEGAADEQFIYLIQGQTASLEGYHINSNTLVVK